MILALWKSFTFIDITRIIIIVVVFIVIIIVIVIKIRGGDVVVIIVVTIIVFIIILIVITIIVPWKKGIEFLTSSPLFACLCVCLASRWLRDGWTKQHGLKWGQYYLQDKSLVKMVRFRFPFLRIIRIKSHFGL